MFLRKIQLISAFNHKSLIISLSFDTVLYNIKWVLEIYWRLFNSAPPKVNFQKIAILLLIILFALETPVASFAQEQEPINLDSPPPNEGLEEVESVLKNVNNDNFIFRPEPTLESIALPNPNINDSGEFKKKAKIRKISKKTFKQNEKIEVIVDDAKAEELEISIFDPDNNKIDLSYEIVKSDNPAIIKINPPSKRFKPGHYQVSIKDSEGNITNEDFTWGVLAINSNKAIYLPEEYAHFSIAVLDEVGNMVCNALLRLEIKASDGQATVLSSEEGTIVVNPECNTKKFITVPDYEALYQVGGLGKYNLTLTATTQNGTYSIENSFEVKDSVPFDIERITQTRIYPFEKYPVEILVTANQDFSGTIEEIVPGSFEIESESTNILTRLEATESAKPLESQSLESPQVSQENAAEDKSSEITTEFTKVEEYSSGEQVGVQNTNIELRLPFDGEYPLTQGFGGNPDDPLLAKKYNEYGVIGHDGLDFATPIGTEILAVDNGEVLIARENFDYGTTVVIKHSWGKSYYGHLSKLLVEEGENINIGTPVGLSGNTGLSTGPHLHFGVKLKHNDSDNGFFGKTNPMLQLGTALIAQDPRYSNILSKQTPTGTNIEFKKVVWDVNIKKGEKISLLYKYKAPLESPQLYSIGPVVLKDKTGKTVFNEERQWQIAADSPGNTLVSVETVTGTTGTGASIIANFSNGTQLDKMFHFCSFQGNVADNLHDQMFKATALTDIDDLTITASATTPTLSLTYRCYIVIFDASSDLVVQRFTTPTLTADTANNQAITQVSATAQTFVIPHGETDPSDTTIGSEEIWEYQLTSTTNVAIFLDGGNNTAHPGVKFEVVDWGNADINVQHINNNSMTTLETTDAVNITAVDQANTWLIGTNTWAGVAAGSSPTDDFGVRLDFQDNDTIQLRKLNSGVAVEWSAQVIEDVSAGGIWDVDLGTIAMSTAETSDTFTIGSVDTTRTFVNGTTFNTFGYTGQSSDVTTGNVDSATATVTLTNDTTITAVRGINEGTLDIPVQAVEFLAAAATPTLDQLMRHGAWFNAGVEQPFTF